MIALKIKNGEKWPKNDVFFWRPTNSEEKNKLLKILFKGQVLCSLPRYIRNIDLTCSIRTPFSTLTSQIFTVVRFIVF